MKKHKIWGIAIFILLLGIATVFIFLDEHAELRQFEQETVKSDKLREEHNKLQEVETQIADVDKLPPSENAETRYVHEDSTVHPDTHEATEVRTDKSALPSPEELKERVAALEAKIPVLKAKVGELHSKHVTVALELEKWRVIGEKHKALNQKLSKIRAAEEAGHISMSDAVTQINQLMEEFRNDGN